MAEDPKHPILYRKTKPSELEQLAGAKDRTQRPDVETWAGTAGFDPYESINLEIIPINPLAVIWAGDTAYLREEAAKDPTGRLSEEVQATRGVNYGILSKLGRSELLIDFRNKILLATEGRDLPIIEVGKNRFLVASGSMTDPLGESIYPLANNGKLHNTALMGILDAALKKGTWDIASKRWTGVLIFYLPFQDLRDGEDATEAAKLANYLCPYRGKKRGCPGKSFLRDLRSVAESLAEKASARGYSEFAQAVRGMREHLDEIPIGFQGSAEEVLEEGFLRGGPGVDKLYGSAAHLRGLTTNRLGLRSTLHPAIDTTRKGKHERKERIYRLSAPAVEKTLAELYEASVASGDQEQADLIAKAAEGMTAQGYKNIDEKELVKFESKIWRKAAKKGKGRAPTFTLPLAVPAKVPGHPKAVLRTTPIKSIAFTLYGIDPEDAEEIEVPAYRVLHQAGPFSIEDIQRVLEEIRRSAPPPDDEEGPMKFNELWALRRFAARKLDLFSYTAAWGKRGSPVPITLLATIKVDQKMATAWQHFGLPKPYELTKDLGLYFSEISIPKVPRVNIPYVAALDNVWSDVDTQSGLYPQKIGGNQYKLLLTNLMRMSFTSKRRLSLDGIPRKSLFSVQNVSQMQDYKDVLERLIEKNAEAKSPRSMEALRESAYYYTIYDGIAGSFGPKKTPPGVRGARYGYTALGGGKGRAKRTSEGKYKGPGNLRWGTETMFAWKNIFSFADRVCRTVEGACAEGRVYREKIQGADIAEAMAQFGIHGTPDDFEALTDLHDALKKALGDSREPYYTHRASTGELESGLESPYLDVLRETAKPNSYYGRRSRKPRRKRRARRNTLRDTEEALAYLRKGTPESEEAVERQLAALAQRESPEDWLITEDKVNELFPREGKARQWELQERLPALTHFDLVSRAGHLPPPEEEVRSELESGAMPFSGEAARAYIGKEAELSLQETQAMLLEQRKKRQSPYTMQPSSAICKNYRRKKLTTYSVPSAVWNNAVKNKDIVLWISPLGSPPRVMTVRRGTHIDCDMVSQDPAEMGELLGRALQSSLYWLVERRARRIHNTRLWVGRAGDTHLYLAWQPGEDVSISRVMGNLAEAQKKSAEFSKPIMSPGEAEKEVGRYDKAVRKLFGYRPRRGRGSTRKSREPRELSSPGARSPGRRDWQSISTGDLMEGSGEEDE